MTEQTEKDRQNRTGRKKQAERTGRKGQAGQEKAELDGQIRTGRTGKALGRQKKMEEALTCSLDMQHCHAQGHAARTCSNDMQQGHAARTSSMDMRHEHAG